MYFLRGGYVFFLWIEFYYTRKKAEMYVNISGPEDSGPEDSHINYRVSRVMKMLDFRFWELSFK